MKKISLIIVFLCTSTFIFSQQKLKDRASIKLGLIGGWVSYEKAFSDTFTLNSELGLEGGFFGGSLYEEDFNYIGTLTLSTEPRYYYNIPRRVKKSKNTNNNSANFWSIELRYIPDWVTVSNVEYVNVIQSFGVIPKYGFNRNISKNFNFEFAVGMGYEWLKRYDNQLTGVLDLRFSFDFK